MNHSMTTILITGVTGFIGARYAKRARQRGWRVIGTDLPVGDREGSCDEYLSLDLSAPDALLALEALPQAEIILHAGGVSGFMVATDRPRHIVDVNIGGSLPIFLLSHKWQVRRTVMCSTMMVYGSDAKAGVVHDEAEYPAPISVYGASKVAVEALMHGFNGQYGTDIVAIRPGLVYGPGRTTQCFVRDMLQAVHNGIRCEIPQTGSSWRQYVHVDDICESIDCCFAVTDPAERVFNITGAEIHTLREVAAMISGSIGPLDITFRDEIDLPNYRIGELSNRRARDVLGYAPAISLEAGLRSYWTECFTPGAPGS